MNIIEKGGSILRTRHTDDLVKRERLCMYNNIEKRGSRLRTRHNVVLVKRKRHVCVCICPNINVLYSILSRQCLEQSTIAYTCERASKQRNVRVAGCTSIKYPPSCQGTRQHIVERISVVCRACARVLSASQARKKITSCGLP